MTDSEWLDYFESHCRTPRAGFVKSNIDKLRELAGLPPFPDLRDGEIYTVRENVIDPWVQLARDRMRQAGDGQGVEPSKQIGET